MSIFHHIHECDNDDIILTYDGDDWFYNENVFQNINKIYQYKDVWITLGCYMTFPDGKAIYKEDFSARRIYEKDLTL